MDIAVATMTKVRGRAEEARVASALARLATLGVPVAVCDGGSPPRFVHRIRTLPNIVMTGGRGLVAQVQASIACAARTGAERILYTEPDKLEFFDDHVQRFLRTASRRNAGVVLAARSDAASRTFPEVQRLAEAAASRLCADIIGLETDYFYGPFLFDAGLASVVSRAAARLGWGWRPFLFAAASRRGTRCSAVEGDYRCPSIDRRESRRDREYRLRQMVDNVRGLVAALDESSSTRPAARRR